MNRQHIVNRESRRPIIGVTGPDQTQIGLYLMRTDVNKRLYNIPVVNTSFKVPANSVKDVVATFPPIPLPLSAKAILIFPHMHLLGTKIRAELMKNAWRPQWFKPIH